MKAVTRGESHSAHRDSCAALFIIVLWALIGCAASSRDRFPFSGEGAVPESRRILAVPFYPGEDLQCGPASLAALLRFWGIDRGPDEIAGRIHLRDLKGTLPLDMETYTQEVTRDGDVRGTVIRDRPEILREEISVGRPLLIFVDLGYWVWHKGHFMLVVGFDDRKEAIVANSGRESGKIIPARPLWRQWRKTGFWAIRMAPIPPQIPYGGAH